MRLIVVVLYFSGLDLAEGLRLAFPYPKALPSCGSLPALPPTLPRREAQLEESMSMQNKVKHSAAFVCPRHFSSKARAFG